MKRGIACIFAIIVCFGIYWGSAQASVSFSASFDSGLDAQSGTDKTAYTDATLPSLVTGYGGVGQAIKNTFGTTLKYKTSNLNQNKDSISFKFQLPFDTNEGLDKGRIGESFSYIDVSETTGYTYIADFTADQIIRTKIDGSGWERLGNYGTGGDGKFNFCWSGDVSVDSRDETLYITDSCNKRIIKTKMDGSDWQAYPIGAYSPAKIFYDKVSDEIYFYDEGGDQIVSTKFGSDVFNAVSLGGVSTYMTDFIYDSAGGFIYLLDGSASNLSRIKMDGSGLAAFGSSGSGINEFDSPYALDYDGTYFYIMDEYNYRIVKTQFDGTGWQTYGSQGLGEGKFNDATGIAYDDNSGDIFVLDSPDRYTNNPLLIKTKIDGSIWQSFATQGVGSINDFDSMVYDNNTGYYYFAAAFNQVIRTKKDGTDWTIVGTHGDGNTPFSFGYVAGLDVDKTTGEVYTVDHYANQISKFLMDESEWEAWKGPEPGNGALCLSVPRGVSIDQVSKEIYTADMDHSRIIKTKMDGSNMWEAYGTGGSGVGQFDHPMNVHYDPITEYVYVSDDGNPRIVRFKMNGGDPQWQSLDTSAYSDWGVEFIVQDGTDFVYFNDYVNQRVVKVKMDGTGTSYIDPLSWDVASELAYGATPVYFDASSESLFFTNARNIYRTDMNGNLIEKVTGTPNKVLFTTSGSKPMEIGISAYSGKFSLTLNSYELPISNSQVQTLTSGSWHSIQISFDRTAGTMSAYLDGSTTPFISRSGMSSQLLKSMSDVGEYFYIGSDPTDPNRTFPGAIDDVTFGLPDPVPVASATATATTLKVLPETGRGESFFDIFHDLNIKFKEIYGS